MHKATRLADVQIPLSFKPWPQPLKLHLRGTKALEAVLKLEEPFMRLKEHLP